MAKKFLKERFTVLAHSFNDFDEARDYVQQLADVGECKALPVVQKWDGKIKAWWWQPYLDNNGKIRFK